MDRTSGCVCRHRGSCLVPVRVRRWRMTKQVYEYNRPRPSKSRGISSLRNLNLNPAPPRRGCIERNRGRVILFSSLDFSFSFFLLPTLVFSSFVFSFHIEYTHLEEEIIFASIELTFPIIAATVDRLWWLSFCTFRCFGVNRKRGRRGNRINRAVGEKDEKVGKTCCVYRIYIYIHYSSFSLSMWSCASFFQWFLS